MSRYSVAMKYIMKKLFDKPVRRVKKYLKVSSLLLDALLLSFSVCITVSSDQSCTVWYCSGGEGVDSKWRRPQPTLCEST